MRALLGIVAVTVLFGCATVPKPQELLALEQLRQGRAFKQAKEEQAVLIKKSEKAYEEAIAAWEDEELELSKHYALMGSIQVRTALSIIEQASARARFSVAQKQLKQVNATYADLVAEVANADEQLRLHQQLAAAKKDALAKQAQLAEKLTEAQKREEEQKRLAEAQKLVSAAGLAVKMADTVAANKYASGDYSVAASMLKRAETALKEGKLVEATTTANAAKTSAEAAYAAARPQFAKDKEAAARKAQNQALQKDAAAIGGVTVKMKTVGQTQQLILPVTSLFARRKAIPKPEKMGVLNQIGALLKKYPTYPVLINGYTSYRVRRSQQYAVSQARAQAVAHHFASMGIKVKRFVVTGRGSEELIGRRRDSMNDRVEVIILFQ